MNNGVLDQPIVEWFESGRFYEALIGQSDYFVLDPFYRGKHDVLLVVSTMVRWAIKCDKVDFARERFIDAIQRMLENDVVAGMDALNCYL